VVNFKKNLQPPSLDEKKSFIPYIFLGVEDGGLGPEGSCLVSSRATRKVIYPIVPRRTV